MFTLSRTRSYNQQPKGPYIRATKIILPKQYYVQRPNIT